MASMEAQIAKDKGNTAFKAKNWAEAIGHYSQALIADRSNPTIPLNRAAAYLKLDKFQDAERDCTAVLSIDPKNVKAFFRRAQARSALGFYSEAEKDLLDALKLEPSNDSVKSELSSVQTQKLKSKQVPAPSSLPPSPPPTKRRVRNVPIEIIEPDQDIAPTHGVSTSAATAAKDSRDQNISDKPQSTSPSPAFLTQVQSRTLSPSAAAPASSPSPSLSPSSSALPPPTVSSKPPPRVGGGLFRADGKFTIIRSPQEPSTPTPSQDIPQTHFAFSRRWDSLKTSQERLSLIQLIPPESLPTLFKSNLTPELLISILQTFLEITSASPDRSTLTLIMSYMSHIPLISRFDTVVLFFSPKEKEVAGSLWDHIDPDGKNESRVLWNGRNKQC